MANIRSGSFVRLLNTALALGLAVALSGCQGTLPTSPVAGLAASPIAATAGITSKVRD